MTTRLQSLLSTADANIVISTMQDEAARLRLLARGMKDKGNRQSINLSAAADTIDGIINRLNAPFVRVA